MKKLMTAAVLGCLVGLAGCDNRGPAAPASATGVAVLDLDKVAKAMGWVGDMEKNLKASQTDLEGQLDDFIKVRKKAIDDKKTEIATEAKLTAEQTKALKTATNLKEIEGLPLTDTQKQTLTDTVGRAGMELQQAGQMAREEFNKRRMKLIVDYRDKVRPIASRVASAKGMGVVLMPADNVLSFDPKTADITDEVIAELQKLPGAAPTTQP